MAGLRGQSASPAEFGVLAYTVQNWTMAFSPIRLLQKSLLWRPKRLRRVRSSPKMCSEGGSHNLGRHPDDFPHHVSVIKPQTFEQVGEWSHRG